MLLRRGLLLLGSVLLGACAEPLSVAPGPGAAALDPSCTGPARSIPASLRLPPPQGGFRTVDDRWAEIARQVPGGWGGFFYVDGQPTVYLVDPAQKDAALAALQPLLGRSDVQKSAVLQGRWDFAQLYDWYRYLNQHAWNVRGVNSSDIDEARNRLVYGATDEAARQQLVEKLASLGVPCGLVLVEIRAPARLA